MIEYVLMLGSVLGVGATKLAVNAQLIDMSSVVFAALIINTHCIIPDVCTVE